MLRAHPLRFAAVRDIRERDVGFAAEGSDGGCCVFCQGAEGWEVGDCDVESIGR